MSSVDVTTRGPSRPGIGGSTGTEPVPMKTFSPRTETVSLPALTSSSRLPTKRARPVITVAVSCESTIV